MRFTLRLKFIVFSLISVGVSILTLSYFSTELVSKDKESYILEYLGASSQSALQKTVSYLERLELQLKVFGSHIQPVLRESEKRWISEYFQGLKNSYGLESLVILAENNITGNLQKKEWTPLIQLGDGVAEVRSALWSKLPEIESTPKDEELRFLNAESGFLTLYGNIPDAIGRPVLVILRVNDRVFENEIQKLKLPFTTYIEFQSVSKSVVKDISIDEIIQYKSDIKAAFADPFAEGVRLLGNQLLFGYAKNENRKLNIGIFTDKKLVNDSIWAINRQAIQIGLSLFLTVASFMALFAKHITESLKRLSKASQSVSEGNFDLPQLATSEKTKFSDEVSDLSKAFRVMTQKIKELIIQTAHKARMEKELETAQLVQKSFFPKNIHRSSSLGLSVFGSCLPASECGGDWWHTYQIGNSQLIVIGDVTGHGAHAALVTAAVYAGTLSSVKRQVAKLINPQEFLGDLILDLNEIVAKSGGGHVSMSFCAMIISNYSGDLILHYINAGHPPAYLQKAQSTTVENANILSQFSSLNQGQVGLLGSIEDLEIKDKVSNVVINKGSSIFMYTDGLMETRKSDSEKISKKQFLKMLIDEKKENNSEEFIQAMMKQMLEFYGEGLDVRPDDITLVEIRTESNAEFSTESQAA